MCIYRWITFWYADSRRIIWEDSICYVARTEMGYFLKEGHPQVATKFNEAKELEFAHAFAYKVYWEEYFHFAHQWLIDLKITISANMLCNFKILLVCMPIIKNKRILLLFFVWHFFWVPICSKLSINTKIIWIANLRF